MLFENVETQPLAAGKQRLLLIDDNPTIIAALRLLFEDEYDTYDASTVGEGLRLFATIRPPVVILDLKLPDQSGIDALREIRRINPVAAVVILTGYSTRLAAEESLRLGAVDYINKPFEASDLKNRIAKLILSRKLLLPENATPLAKDTAMVESMTAFREMQNASAAFLHDVAGPLSCLMAGSDLLNHKVLEQNDTASDEMASVIAMMGDNVRFLRALVEQWRTFSNLHVLMQDRCDIQKAVDLAVNQVMDMIALSGVAFQVEFHRHACSIPGNHFALARVLINLIRNAYEAISPLTGRISLTITASKDQVCMVVSDNGPGIKPEQMAKLFTPHFTTKSSGRGFGLFISQKIIEAIEGRIEVQCPGKMGGTDFIITLPLV